MTYEAFINLLVHFIFRWVLVRNTNSLHQVEIMEDQTSPAQLRDSFRGIAADKVSLSPVCVCVISYSVTNYHTALRHRARSTCSPPSTKCDRLPARGDAYHREWRWRTRVRLRSLDRRSICINHAWSGWKGFFGVYYNDFHATLHYTTCKTLLNKR